METINAGRVGALSPGNDLALHILERQHGSIIMNGKCFSRGQRSVLRDRRARENVLAFILLAELNYIIPLCGMRFETANTRIGGKYA